MRVSRNRARAVCGWVSLLVATPCLAQFTHDGDVAIRYDDTSDRESRSQYRLRYKPQFRIDANWSVHGFIATGDEFDSAYNTINETDGELHVRRFFARYADGNDKIEVGVIPPFKGRVSSTGLSKEGWIRGARIVRGTRNGSFEVVLGDLEDLSASNALRSPFDLSYIEVEYSGRIDESWSFELGGEEILGDRFVRGELRYLTRDRSALAAELIHNASAGDSKIVLSLLRESARPGKLKWFTYYTHTGAKFGSRAELSEDFLDVGHALATKLEGAVVRLPRVGWFAEFELYEDQSRIKLGLQVSID